MKYNGEDSQWKAAEKWIYLKDCLSNENARAWVDDAGDRLSVPRRTISDKKSHFYYKILHDGGSVNAERYIEFLEHMVEHF